MSNTILHDKCAAFEDKIKELEEKLAIAIEALAEISEYGEYGDHKDTVKIYRHASEALLKIKNGEGV